jgi:hypothetical protein
LADRVTRELDRSSATEEAPRLAARARRLLRAPRTILINLGAVGVAGVLGATLPQRAGDPERWRRWAEEWPRLSSWLSRLDLDRVYDSGWFLALVLLSGASLCVVLVEQWRRLPSEWRAPPAAAFANAPFRAEFDRAIRGSSGDSVRSTGRLGVLGSPLMHGGIALIMVAGIIHVLFATVAQEDVYVGETIGTRPQDWGMQWPGRIAPPVALPWPITFASYEPDVDPAGATRMLSATFRSGSVDGELRRAAVNDPARVGSVSMYVDRLHGPAAFVILEGAGEKLRQVLLLREAPGGDAASAWLRDGTELRFRAERPAKALLPDRVEVRALRQGALLGSGSVAPGEELAFPGGARVELAGLRWWSRFTAKRDPSVAVVFAGFGLALLGTILNVVFVRTDVLVRVEAGAEPETEHVLVALRPRRLAPLFRERFEALVRAEGGAEGAS